MRAIKGKDTRPELIVRKALHAAGFRDRLHATSLRGKPDLVLRKYDAVIFVHGCFWHKHDCSAFKMPRNRRAFWKKKIQGNATRDSAAQRELKKLGWRVATVWECSLRGPNRRPTEQVVRSLARWLNSERKTLKIRAKGKT